LAERPDVRHGLALAVALAVLVGTRAASAAEPEPPPDAQLLLDLDLLSETKPQERDLMRRMSVVERWRLLEMMRMLDARPPAVSTPPPPPPPPPAVTGQGVAR
jgi:hypothetical protein